MSIEKKDSVGILGCGWLGLPLAQHLVNQGYDVHGSSTQKEKLPLIAATGAIPAIVHCDESEAIGLSAFLKKIDCLILTLPPGIRKHPKRRFDHVIKTIHREVTKQGVQKVIFISSTAVYGDAKGWIDESTSTTAVTESGKQLVRCEQQWLTTPGLNATILRFGGLVGPNRHPIYALAKRDRIDNPKGKINFIHLNDCIKLISLCLNSSRSTGIFNGVSPYHPHREEYYLHMAKLAGIKLPHFDSSQSHERVISSQKAENELGMHFAVDNLLTLN